MIRHLSILLVLVSAPLRLCGFILLLPALLLLPPAHAQSVAGAIVGVIKDPQGAVVPNASVLAKNVATGAEAATETDESGFYRLLNLLPGEYVLEIQMAGFRKMTTTAQRVSTGDILRLDVVLQLGQVTESMQVNATAIEVNTSDAQLGSVMRDLANLPLVSSGGGRNALVLVFTSRVSHRGLAVHSPPMASARGRTITSSTAPIRMT